MKYGLHYMGSKNKLAVRILDCLPRGGTLVDLFCGGCAVSHAAMCLGRYDHIIINDRDWRCPTLFMDALQGKFKDERRWISREDFHRLKATDPYVAFVWSFGNNLRDYLYGEDIEPFKRAIHYAIYFDDVEPARAFGLDLEWVLSIHGERQRYLAIKHYLQRGGAGVLFPNAGGERLQYRERHHSLPDGTDAARHHALSVEDIRGGAFPTAEPRRKGASHADCSTPKPYCDGGGEQPSVRPENGTHIRADDQEVCHPCHLSDDLGSYSTPKQIIDSLRWHTRNGGANRRSLNGLPRCLYPRHGHRLLRPAV